MAVAALRQAHAADYGNYEAAWKLARAAFFVGDRTDNDSERDDMFREGTRPARRPSNYSRTNRRDISGSAQTTAAGGAQHAREPLELSGH